jgi:hypothetical protein
VFYDRVHNYAPGMRAPLLAHVFAHEITHVLQGPWPSAERRLQTVLPCRTKSANSSSACRKFQAHKAQRKSDAGSKVQPVMTVRLCSAIRKLAGSLEAPSAARIGLYVLQNELTTSWREIPDCGERPVATVRRRCEELA